MQKKDFKPTQGMVNAAMQVFVAMALVQTIEPVVHGYQRKVLEEHRFKVADKVILDPAKAWTLTDQDFRIYIEETNIERKKAGLKVDDPECCPLLVVENDQRKAERLLIIAMKPITGINPDDVYNLDNYKKLVDLSLKLLAPFVPRRVQ